MKSFEELKSIFDRIYSGINGYNVSLMEKNNKLGEKYFKNIIYGETPFELLYAFFCLNPTKDYLFKAKTFYDLGCGIGNNVIGSYMIGNFRKCVGVELMDSLYDLCLNAKKKLVDLDKMAENKVEFLHTNILDVELSAADIVFFHCPNTDENILEEMEEKFIKELHSGTLILSLIYPFQNSEFFETLEKQTVRVAWGKTQMNIYLKK
jgi:SAM-dependent methyltransferase